jgi:hypothetical protein
LFVTVVGVLRKRGSLGVRLAEAYGIRKVGGRVTDRLEIERQILDE